MAKRTKKRPARRVPAKSTALVRRPAQRLEIQLKDPARRLPELTAAALLPATLGDDASIGELGFAELVLTTKEEEVLARDVNRDKILVKPTGQPYLSHPEYTRWFNDAFGRLGWALVPRAKPMKSGKAVVCPYLLYIHGKAVSFAYGEQEYHENNREQTYGDAVEATVASALRRCAKHLGIGLELWDKRFLNGFLDERCVKVPVTVNGEKKWHWRLKAEKPFWNEIRGRRAREEDTGEPPSGSSAPADYDEGEVIQVNAGTNPKGNDPITPEQVTRLWTLVKKAGRDRQKVKTWIEFFYEVSSSKDIKRKDYEAICTAIEAPGDLGKPAGRE